MNLEDQLRRGATFPNLDFHAKLVAPYTDKQYHVVFVAAELLGFAAVAPIGPNNTVFGILQNAPDTYDEAIVRYSGRTYAVYGDTVAAGDLLTIEDVGDYDRLVPWVLGTTGHTHVATTIPNVKVMVKVTNILTGAAVTGLTSTGILVKQFREDGPTTEQAASTSVTELSAGWYLIATTSVVNSTQAHRLSIDVADASHVASINEYQWTPGDSTAGPPNYASYKYMVGQALSDGVANGVGLVLLRTQLF